MTEPATQPTRTDQLLYGLGLVVVVAAVILAAVVALDGRWWGLAACVVCALGMLAALRVLRREMTGEHEEGPAVTVR